MIDLHRRLITAGRTAKGPVDPVTMEWPVFHNCSAMATGRWVGMIPRATADVDVLISDIADQKTTVAPMPILHV